MLVLEANFTLCLILVSRGCDFKDNEVTCYVGDFKGMGYGEGCICNTDMCNSAAAAAVSVLTFVSALTAVKLF